MKATVTVSGRAKVRSFSRHCSSEATGSSNDELAELHGEVAGVVLDGRDVVDGLAQPARLGVGEPLEGAALDIDEVRDVDGLVETRESYGASGEHQQQPRKDSFEGERRAEEGRRGATSKDSTGYRRP